MTRMEWCLLFTFSMRVISMSQPNCETKDFHQASFLIYCPRALSFPNLATFAFACRYTLTSHSPEMRSIVSRFPLSDVTLVTPLVVATPRLTSSYNAVSPSPRPHSPSTSSSFPLPTRGHVPIFRVLVLACDNASRAAAVGTQRVPACRGRWSGE